MKIRKFLIAVLSLACIAATAAFAGCKIGALSPDETKEKFDLVASVNYYGNGGIFQNNKSTLTIYYRDGDSIIDVGDGSKHAGTFLHSGTLSVKRDNAELSDWYYATLDGEGNPVFNSPKDEEEGRCQYDPTKKVEFPVTIKKDEVLHLVAGWQSKISAKFVLADAIGGKEKGAELYSMPFGENGTVTVDNQLIAALGEELSGNTFVSCFADEECKTPVTTLSASDYEEECTVFVKFLEGEWSIIRNGTDIVSMLRDGSKKYYLYQDIDCSSLSGTWQLEWQQIKSFTGTLSGNGCKVTGLKIEGELTTAQDRYALFGAIGAEAKISDITFDGLSFGYKRGLVNTPRAEIFALCSGMANGATLKNVTINGTLSTTLVLAGYYKGAAPATLTLGEDIKVTVQ